MGVVGGKCCGQRGSPSSLPNTEPKPSDPSKAQLTLLHPDSGHELSLSESDTVDDLCQKLSGNMECSSWELELELDGVAVQAHEHTSLKEAGVRNKSEITVRKRIRMRLKSDSKESSEGFEMPTRPPLPRPRKRSGADQAKLGRSQETDAKMELDHLDQGDDEDQDESQSEEPVDDCASNVSSEPEGNSSDGADIMAAISLMDRQGASEDYTDQQVDPDAADLSALIEDCSELVQSADLDAVDLAALIEDCSELVQCAEESVEAVIKNNDSHAQDREQAELEWSNFPCSVSAGGTYQYLVACKQCCDLRLVLSGVV